MFKEFNRLEDHPLTRRAAVAAGVIGAMSALFPQVSHASESLSLTRIHNGWLVEDIATGEFGTIVFSTDYSFATINYPNGRVSHFEYLDDGTTVIDGKAPSTERGLSTRSVPSGFSFLGTITYDFGPLDLAGTVLAFIGIGLSATKAYSVAAAIFSALGYAAGKVADLDLEVDNYLNRSTTESYWVCRVYKGSSVVYRFEVGPFTGSRPDF